jgi:hypothetical protein
MIKIIINKVVNIRWLTRELQAAGVTVFSVSEGYAEVLAAHETLALSVIAAHDPLNNPDILEKLDMDALKSQITNELAWIVTARADITTGIGVIDGGATLVQLRGVVKGLAQIMDRMLQEQDKELRAWRFVIRKLS